MPPIERITPRSADLGEGPHVRRALPTRERRMIGAWCFLDHAGPVDFAPGGGMHVGAHPHTALQTFTWLIDGEVLHRDSLGNEQVIRPGQVNLMTAGHGIVHTEDSLPDARRLHAAQLWIALPPEHADCPPAFEHHPVLPRWAQDGCTLTLLAGRHGERQSPARLHSPLIGLDICSSGDARLTLPLDPGFEYGILPLEGSLRIGDETFDSDAFACFARVPTASTWNSPPTPVCSSSAACPSPSRCSWPGTSSVTAGRPSPPPSATGKPASPRFGAVDGSTRRQVAPPLPWIGH
jgi:redox-sensitive bicupin YhaK (pirin superfamily)